MIKITNIFNLLLIYNIASGINEINDTDIITLAERDRQKHIKLLLLFLLIYVGIIPKHVDIPDINVIINGKNVFILYIILKVIKICYNM